jgi:hypothetical protein
MSFPLIVTNSSLWQHCFADKHDQDDEHRQFLRAELTKLRSNIEPYAERISSDLPTFTVHNISHLDGLWGVASTIVGDQPHLNPIEGFVLGAAILIHDLGMAAISDPNGVHGIRQSSYWKDTVAIEMLAQNGSPATQDQINNPPEQIARRATMNALRVLHAERAKQLLTEEIGGRFLLENQDLRLALGAHIGNIASSHGLSLNEMVKLLEVGTIGTPVEYPQSWTIDLIRIACLLRVTDAAHLDSSRAPERLLVLQNLPKDSLTHWEFQVRMLQVHKESNFLKFTSVNTFTLENRDAWWLALDTLKMVNHELRGVHDLLVVRDKPLFAVHGVLGVENAKNLMTYLPVAGWTPAEVSVQVSNVTAMVKRLGGSQLYGENLDVPIRELLQNAIDAVRARRILDNQSINWGEVTVFTGQDELGSYFEISDNGIGMSISAIQNGLLDFGTSFWASSQITQEHPGLMSKGFQPSGRFGIGFFSVFMLGSRVQVVSRKFGTARDNTAVLEFTGLEVQPSTRSASTEEQIGDDGGTRIRVWLNQDIKLRFEQDWGSNWLEKICKRVCLTPDCSIAVRNTESKKVIRSANDWLTISGKELLIRALALEDVNFKEKEEISSAIEKLGRRVTDIVDSEKIMGRGMLHNSSETFQHFLGSDGIVIQDECVISLDGFRGSIQNHKGMVGIFLGKPDNLVRQNGNFAASLSAIGEWVLGQANFFFNLAGTPDAFNIQFFSRFVAKFHSNLEEFPFVLSENGWLNLLELNQYLSSQNDLIYLTTPKTMNYPVLLPNRSYRNHGDEFELIDAFKYFIATDFAKIRGYIRPRHQIRMAMPVFIPGTTQLVGSPPYDIDLLPDGITLDGCVISILSRSWNLDSRLMTSEFLNRETVRVIRVPERGPADMMTGFRLQRPT